MHKKIVIIPSWGAGFYADFLHVVQGVEFAKKIGAEASICWGSNSLYYHDSEVFSQLFKIEHNQSLIDYKVSCNLLGTNLIDKPILASVHDKKIDESEWINKLLNDLTRNGYCIYNRYIFKFASIMNISQNEDFPKKSFKALHVPLDFIKNEADEFINRINGEYVAVHVRGSEKVRTEENSRMLAQIYIERCKKINVEKLALLTEDPIIEAVFKGDKDLGFTLHIPDAERKNIKGKNLLGREGMEQVPGFLNTNRPGAERISDAYKVVRDVLIGTAGVFFIGSESNVSKSINFLRSGSGCSEIIKPNFLKVLG